MLMPLLSAGVVAFGSLRPLALVQCGGDAVPVLQFGDGFPAQEPGDVIPCSQVDGRDHPRIP
jgi:hypothetical protein